jgi:hypothetical protein
MHYENGGHLVNPKAGRQRHEPQSNDDQREDAWQQQIQ